MPSDAPAWSWLTGWFNVIGQAAGYGGCGTRIRTQSRFRPRAGRETCPVRSWCLSAPGCLKTCPLMPCMGYPVIPLRTTCLRKYRLSGVVTRQVTLTGPCVRPRSPVSRPRPSARSLTPASTPAHLTNFRQMALRSTVVRNSYYASKARAQVITDSARREPRQGHRTDHGTLPHRADGGYLRPRLGRR